MTIFIGTVIGLVTIIIITTVITLFISKKQKRTVSRKLLTDVIFTNMIHNTDVSIGDAVSNLKTYPDHNFSDLISKEMLVE